jgi:hypothetical protein
MIPSHFPPHFCGAHSAKRSLLLCAEKACICGMIAANAIWTFQAPPR